MFNMNNKPMPKYQYNLNIDNPYWDFVRDSAHMFCSLSPALLEIKY